MPTRRFVLGSMLAATTVGSAARAAQTGPEEARSRFAFEARVTVAPPVVVGPSVNGLRRIVPITGGTFSGPRIEGRVIPGGADWQHVRADGVLSIEARYTAQQRGADQCGARVAKRDSE